MHLHTVAEGFDASGESAEHAGAIAAVEVVAAQVAVGNAVAQDVVRRREDRGRDGDHGFLGVAKPDGGQ